MNKLVTELINDLSNLDVVEAIVLGGSQSTEFADKYSDYDIYIYFNNRDMFSKVKPILAPYMNKDSSLHMCFTEEICVALKDYTHVELVLKTLNEAENELKKRLIDYKCDLGFSTCDLATIFNGLILYDNKKYYQNLKEKYSFPYPKKLAESIIAFNKKMINGRVMSIDKQILKAIKRNDFIVIQRWCSQYIASYFDILFALNKTYHTGEKRMLQFAIDNFDILPDKFEFSILALARYNDTIDYEKLLLDMIQSLDSILSRFAN